MKIKNLRILFLLLVGVGMLTSCGDDPISGEGGPVLSVDYTGTGELAAGSTFNVILTATMEDVEMNSITISEDGVKMDVGNERIKLDGALLSGNPVLLFGTDRESFTYAISIEAQNGASTNTYSFLVTDADGVSSEKTLDITTLAEPLTVEYLGSEVKSGAPDALISANIVATKGGTDLSSIEVFVDGVSMDATDLPQFDTNPYFLTGDDLEGFDTNVEIRLPATAGLYSYVVRVTDVAGFEADGSFQVAVGTVITLLEGVLYNRSGPVGTGGLNLLTGDGVGSADGHIRDEGGTENWLQQISGTNGAVVYYLIPAQNGLAEDFSFSSINFKEDVANILGNGTAFTQTNAGGDLVSNVLQVGDLLLVTHGDDSFVLDVKEIVVTPDVGDNSDHYVFDIKY